MTELRNTREGYTPENAELIPDDVDTGIGFAAGDSVTISEDHPVFPDEEGEVYSVCRGQGWDEGTLVVDVLIEGTDTPTRFTAEDIAGVG